MKFTTYLFILAVFTQSLFSTDFSYLEENKTVYIEQAKKMFGNLDKNKADKVDASYLAQNKKFNLDFLSSVLPESYAPLLNNIKAESEDDSKKYLTVFWFFSTSLSDISMETFIGQAATLKEKYPNFQYYGILRGFPKGGSLVEYANKFKDKKGATSLKVKIHPKLYNELSLEKVPAFALAFCPKKFSRKDCQIEFVAKGDMRLDGFFQLVSDYDARYKKFYFDLIDAR